MCDCLGGHFYNNCFKVLAKNSITCALLVLASVDDLFPCELRFSWFLVCWVILDFILDTVVIVLWDPKSCLWRLHGACGHFCFSQQLSSLGSGHKFQSNCGMQFQSSAVFKVLTCFSDLSHVCDTWRPVTTRPIVRLVGMWVRIWSSYMQLDIINIFMGWPLRLCNLPGPFRLPGDLLPNPPPRMLRLQFPHSVMYFYDWAHPGSRWGEDREREKNNEDSPPLPRGTTVHWLEGRIFSLRILAFVGPCVPLLIAWGLKE